MNIASRYLQNCLGFMMIIFSFVGRPSAAHGTSGDRSIPALPCHETLPTFDFKLQKGFLLSNAELELAAVHVAELEDRSEMQSFLDAWGFQDVAFLGQASEGANAYLAEQKDYRLLAFRGSKTLLDKIMDALFASVPLADIGLKGKGHSGMKVAFQILWPKVFQELALRQAIDPKPLVIVGHSLGGSLALMHALRLQKHGFPVQSVYTSGQPRIGDKEFYQDMENSIGDRYYRLVNPEDMTVMIPPSAAAAESFASIAFSDGTLGHRMLTQLVKSFGYETPRSWKLSISDHLNQTMGSEKDEEISFWHKLRQQLGHLQSLAAIKELINAQAERHPPRAYFCSLKAIREQKNAGRE